MVRSHIVRIIFILLLFFAGFAVGQDNQVKKDQQLREEILAAYKSGGEQGLLDYVKNNKGKISNKFINDFAEAGYKAFNGEWLKICEVIAIERMDKKILAEVLYKTGKYFGKSVDYKKAAKYFDKAFTIFLKLNEPGGQGNVYMSKGDIYQRIDEHSRALEMYKKALLLFEKTKDPLGQGNIYLRNGEIYFKICENAKAIEMYDKAIPFFEKAGAHIGQGNIYMRKGTIYFDTGNNSKAMEMYYKALIFFEKAGDPVGQGNVYCSQARFYSRIGDNLNAIEMYDKALLFFKKARFPFGQGNVNLHKGRVYAIIGKISLALEMYDKAMPFFEKARYSSGQGNVYLSKGDIYLQIGTISKALKMYDKAMPFFEKGGIPSALGNIYYVKGAIYSRIGENSKALEMYNKSLSFFEKAGMSIGQGTVYLSKGEIYLLVGDRSKALEMYNKAMTFFEKAKFPLGQGSVYSSKGDIYFLTGENSRALEMYDKALPLFEKSGDILVLGNVYTRKGDISLKLGDNDRALELYKKALPFFEKTEAPIGQGNVYIGKGNSYSNTGENLKALKMYDEALQLYKKSGDIESESIALHRKAKVLEKLGEKEKALELFVQAIANQEQVRTQTAFSEMKRTFMEKVYEQYEETVLFMLENNYYEKGFKYAESMRSRVFMDRMAEGLVRLDKGLPHDLKEKRDNLVTKLSLHSKELHKSSGKKLQELKQQYQQKENEFEELLIKIRLDNPLYASVKYPQPITIQALQKEVLKKRETLISYFISHDKVCAFLISKRSFSVAHLKLKKNELESLVYDYLTALKENDCRRLERFGKMLYEILVYPLERKLKKNQTIIIVPHRQLATIPFESLIIDRQTSGRPVFLLEKYPIKYIQSASILSVLRKHYQRNKETGNFIGFGDPVYDYENFKLGKPEKGALTRSLEEKDEIKEIHRSRYARSGGILDRLQASGREIKSIAALFARQSQKSAVYQRAQATEDKAKAPEMKDFDYIHFACHGLLNDFFQSLVLSQLPPEKSSEDGYFTLNEIMNCHYNAKLVVLSACETGSGKMYKGEGVTGLTRAVMYAGTPAVVASLWDVDDNATKELMLHFYRNMLEKDLDKAEALRQAKLELIKKEEYRSPLFWSAFVMYGE